MPHYALKALLELREREEQAARRDLAGAAATRAAAESWAERLESRASQARRRHEEAGASPDTTRAAIAAELIGAARFVARLRQESAVAGQALDDFASGPLQAARLAEERAWRALFDARRAREALEAHAARLRDRQRLADGRRAEAVADEARSAARDAGPRR